MIYVTLTAAAVFCFGILFAYRDRLNISLWQCVVLAICHTIAGVAMVKLFAGLESFKNPAEAGMSLFGAIFFMPPIYAVAAKAGRRSISTAFDLGAMAIISALMCVRFNCLYEGCCLGRFITETSTMRWPVREAEIVFYLLVLIYLIRKMNRGSLNGKGYPLFMTLYGAFRFLEECFRENAQVLGPFHYGHIWAVVSFIAGSIVLFLLIEVEKSSKKRARR